MTLPDVLQLHEIDKLVATCRQVDGPEAQIVVGTGGVKIPLTHLTGTMSVGYTLNEYTSN